MRARLLVVLICLMTLGCTAESTPAPAPVTATSASTSVVTPSLGPPLEEIPLSLKWQRVPGLPHDDWWERGLSDVVAAGPDAAWAVGYHGWEDGVKGTLRGWDGSRWRKLVPERPGSLDGVDADGPRNVWAVGGDEYEPLALQWDGRAWRRHKPPLAGLDVAVDRNRAILISSSDAVLWDGARFTKVLELDEKTTDLVAIDGGSDHTWIAGQQNERLMIWHGRNGRFQETKVPVIPASRLSGIWQNSPSDVWAVGAAGADLDPLVLRWDGGSWQRVTLPAGWRGALHSVTAFGPDDVWIAGLDDTYRPSHVMILHWNGRTWRRELPPSPGVVEGALIERIPGTSQIWLMTTVRNGDSESIVTFRRRQH
ncbi:hypothetical protein [Nonomuraea zeae]|uniref:WD40 repeat domain-containing protein n=1 Tax=Nonomuraea zeae TaxID=1642303 RepID=A0A5S4GVJ1_9ACTN|nr:hypothetical protein [Nonomuraea zeae]TMR36966.1 hypothetical protein ETD85_09455 [Nonomuraea zeae]